MQAKPKNAIDFPCDMDNRENQLSLSIGRLLALPQNALTELHCW